MMNERSQASRGELGRLHQELQRDLRAIEPLRAIADRAGELAGFEEDLAEQLERASSAAVVCLVGSTGAGKSTLLNALVGRDIATEGVDRPTTSAPVIYRPADADISELLTGLPGEPPRVVTYDPRDGGGVEAFWRGQILVDAPDTNSVETGHREVVRALGGPARTCSSSWPIVSRWPS